MGLQKASAAAVKLQRGCEEEGSAHPPIESYGPSPSSCQGLGLACNPPSIYWNNKLDGQHTRVLVDNGTRMNTVMPAYV